MSKVIWKINGVPAEDLGITVAGGTFRTQGVSYALLDAARDFDGPQILNHGDAVTLSRSVEGGDTIKVFQGRVAPISKRGTPEYEGHEYPIEDAWAELEATTYQEPWALGLGSYLFPRAVLGIRAVGEDPLTIGDPLTVGQQIAAIINFAIGHGVNLQMGTTPGGEILWPKEVSNISCSEAINQSLELHPDWIPWIDHTTTPPTFHVAAGGEIKLSVLGGDPVVSFSETRRDDLIPDAVRIVYEFATTIDDEVYRNAVIDKYPASAPDGGPRVLCATIPLAGGQMQMQKSRIRVRKMPENGDTSDLAKKWVKANYPRLHDVDIEDFEIVNFTKTLHVDDVADNPHPQIINKLAPRLEVEDVEDIPNQLLEGSIEDWMRRRVGWVNFSVEVRPTGGSLTPAQAAKLAGEMPPGRCVCTNAVTKLYKGVTQWAAAEEIPTGIAQGVYQAAVAAYQYQGEVTLREAELSGRVYHGQALTLVGAATVGALIHTVTWDVGTGETTLSFGPVPELAPADFVELQRRLRGRKVTWWNKEERKDNKLGCEKDPSAAGDSVAGYHHPQIVIDSPPGGPPANPVPLTIRASRPTYIPAPVSPVAEGHRRYYIEWGVLNNLLATNWDAHFDLNATTYFFAKAMFAAGETLLVDSWEILTNPSYTGVTSPDWPVGTPRPAFVVVMLGAVYVTDGVHSISQSGGGSIVVNEHISSIQSGSSTGAVAIGKVINHHRLTY